MTCTTDGALHPSVVDDAGDTLGEPAEVRRQHGPADRAVDGEREGGQPHPDTGHQPTGHPPPKPRAQRGDLERTVPELQDTWAGTGLRRGEPWPVPADSAAGTR